jgi:hypothetical protein
MKQIGGILHNATNPMDEMLQELLRLRNGPNGRG